MACLSESTASAQRDINRRAAVVDSMRLVLLDGPGQRTPGESVNQFLAAVVNIRPKETPAAYDKRVKYYVSVALKSSTVLADLAIPPVGAHTETYSINAWKEIVKLQHYLPRSAKRLQVAMNTTIQTRVPLPAAPLISLINLELAAYQALRDARPALR